MCGIAGAINVEHPATAVSFMLKAMQHRGQQGAGIASVHLGRMHDVREFGLVDEVFAHTEFDRELPGASAIGHVRYPTSGDPGCGSSIQPIIAPLRSGSIAVAHNGNLTNADELRRTLESRGAIIQSDSDTELMLHLMAGVGGSTVERMANAFKQMEGSYTVVVLAQDGVYAAVDPYGFRPLCLARFGNGWLFASETRALDLFQDQPGFDPHSFRHVKPGTIVRVAAGEPEEWTFANVPEKRACSFEQVYFAMPDSMPFGASTAQVRGLLGRALARKEIVRTDVIAAVPDSANLMAAGYAAELRQPLEFALIRSHYAGRTFITPRQTARDLGVRMKLNAVRSIVEGKSVAIVDDSLVRGTTARKFVSLLRSAGAREVHLRLGSPPVTHPCHWGIDTPKQGDLMAARLATPEQIAAELGADSVLYLTVEELRAALGDAEGKRHCVSCFTGHRPEAGNAPVFETSPRHSLPVVS